MLRGESDPGNVHNVSCDDEMSLNEVFLFVSHRSTRVTLDELKMSMLLHFLGFLQNKRIKTLT